MLQLFVPTIGSKLRLLEDWTFSVYTEQRNKTLQYLVGCPTFSQTWPVTNVGTLTLPKDTILRLERIFVREDMEDFDSLTFSIMESPAKRVDPKNVKRVRFWSKLEDCNKIKFEFEI